MRSEDILLFLKRLADLYQSTGEEWSGGLGGKRSIPSISESGIIIKDTESIDIHTSTGPMRTYLFQPATEGRYPGLLLFSEIFQVTGPIRRAASMLASYGFVVGEPDYRLIHIQRAHVTMT